MDLKLFLSVAFGLIATVQPTTYFNREIGLFDNAFDGRETPEDFYGTLRPHAHAINRDFLSFRNCKFSADFFYIFLIFAQNIDCGYMLEPPRRGGSNEYPQSMFWRKIKKNRYTPAHPSFAI